MEDKDVERIKGLRNEVRRLFQHELVGVRLRCWILDNVENKAPGEFLQTFRDKYDFSGEDLGLVYEYVGGLLREGLLYQDPKGRLHRVQEAS